MFISPCIVNQCQLLSNKMRLYTVLLYFLQTTLHVSDDTLIHHQERTQNVITTSGTGRTVFATVRWRGGVVPTPPRQRAVTDTVRPVPDVVITFWVRSWWWLRVSSETCRVVCRKYNKTVYSRILLDNYWHWTKFSYSSYIEHKVHGACRITGEFISQICCILPHCAEDSALDSTQGSPSLEAHIFSSG